MHHIDVTGTVNISIAVVGPVRIGMAAALIGMVCPARITVGSRGAVGVLIRIAVLTGDEAALFFRSALYLYGAKSYIADYRARRLRLKTGLINSYAVNTIEDEAFVSLSRRRS